MKLEKLLRDLNNYHKRIGVTILYNEPNSIWVRIKNKSLKMANSSFVIMIFLSSSKTFSNNDTMNRMTNLLSAVILFEILVNESLFLIQRHKILELVNWCKHVEVLQLRTFNKPYDWFSKARERIWITIR